MDAFEWSTSVYAAAMAMAKSMSREELACASLLFTQLGTTLATFAAIQQIGEGEESSVDFASL